MKKKPEILTWSKITLIVALTFLMLNISAQDYTVPIIFHIARDDNGNNARADATDVNNMMTDLNAAYSAANITFNLCGVRYVDDDRFHTNWDRDIVSEEQLIQALDYTNRVINMVILNFKSGHGHSNFPEDLMDLIEIDYEEIETSTPIHEVGHYFGLLHTYSSSRGDELVNGSNGHIAGDLINDTPADPGGDSNFDSNCNYDGNEKDANGDSYAPDGKNYMSDASNECRSRFSDGQIERIKTTMRLERYYLTSCTPPSSTNPVCTSALSNFPYYDNFDRTEDDSWIVDSEEECGWSFGASTKSSSTGASSAQSGYYFKFLEASDYENSTAGLISPCYDLSGKSSANVRFYYNMYGRDIGNLKLQVSTNNGDSWTDLFSISGQQHTSGSTWTEQDISIDNYINQTIQLRFLGSTLNDSKGDISIDNVAVYTDGVVSNKNDIPSDIFLSNVLISPNPNNGNFNLSLNGKNGTAKVVIVDIEGRTVYETNLHKTEGNSIHNIQVDNVPAGMYILTVMLSNKVQKSYLIIN